ncbi:MAG TPA: hypothetical protein VN496_14315 [Burkholderiales bacterium]|nr:hypothetical protein [Burkholderiales bacterium]
MAAESASEGHLPSFAELQDAGAIIGEVRIINNNIFNLDDPKENNFLFRLANNLHIVTRPEVIRRSLLFSSGERLSIQKIEESERVLRRNRYLYDVEIRPAAYHEGIVDIEVQTRDTWTIQPGLQYSRSGGSNSTALTLRENNLLGTGTSIGYAKTSDVDRNGNAFSLAQHNLFGSWTSIDLTLAKYDDGDHRSFEFGRPFYALDTRWATGVSALHDERIESVYVNGDIVGQYRHIKDASEVFGGWSNGLVDGWTRRYSVGLNYLDDVYPSDPTLAAPPAVPPDQRLVSPFVRYEIIQDDFEKVKNRDKIQRAEFFAIGFNSTIQVGRALTSLGSTRDLWLYSATATRGMHLERGNDLLGSASVGGQYGDGHGERQTLGGSVRYFVPHFKRAVFYVAASGDTIRNPEPQDVLLLGGENGLRGYPLRYQSGEHRALLTIEERVYTDWYPVRLFRVGGAVFYDVGRAWGGPTQNPVNPGWLSDVGFGLRILNDRAAFGNVLHIDLAFPLNPDPNIKSVQFLVRSYLNF